MFALTSSSFKYFTGIIDSWNGLWDLKSGFQNFKSVIIGINRYA